MRLDENKQGTDSTTVYQTFQTFHAKPHINMAATRFDDFSSDDMVYSINLGLKFYTPEMLFKNDPLNFKPLTGVCLDAEYQSSAVEKVEGLQDLRLGCKLYAYMICNFN
jgi:hypothetical protein